MRNYFIALDIVFFLAVLFPLILGYHAALSVIYLLVGLLFHFFYCWGPLEQYTRVYKKREPTAYTLTQQKLYSINRETESDTARSVFTSAHETPSAFLFVDRYKFVYVFPKICFEDRCLIEQTRELLTENFTRFKALA